MKLVIAEKPSVAQSLARVIGADKRQNGYLEGGGYLVSWCVGHLVELSAPECYDERFSKWRLEDLPILPERWLYEVSAGTRKQYQVLKSLMERSDVESLVCATDAGREGELIPFTSVPTRPTSCPCRADCRSTNRPCSRPCARNANSFADIWMNTPCVAERAPY